MKITIMACVLFFSVGAVANTWVRNTKIVDVRWYGTAGYITTEAVNDPEGCSSDANGNRYFTELTAGYKELISMSLTAMMADKHVDVLLHECLGDHNKISGLVVKST